MATKVPEGALFYCTIKQKEEDSDLDLHIFYTKPKEGDVVYERSNIKSIILVKPHTEEQFEILIENVLGLSRVFANIYDTSVLSPNKLKIEHG